MKARMVKGNKYGGRFRQGIPHKGQCYQQNSNMLHNYNWMMIRQTVENSYKRKAEAFCISFLTLLITMKHNLYISLLFCSREKVGMIQNFQALNHFSSFTGITYFSLNDSKHCLVCYSVVWNRISHLCLKTGFIKSSQYYWNGGQILNRVTASA